MMGMVQSDWASTTVQAGRACGPRVMMVFDRQGGFRLAGHTDRLVVRLKGSHQWFVHVVNEHS
jgi:hypothetical protein